MTSRDFCYWLQGYFELERAGDSPNTKIDHGLINAKVEIIRQHLAMVFKHEIDPSMGDAAHQAGLNKIHNTGKADPHTAVMRC
jgi:hypothetical protein